MEKIDLEKFFNSLKMKYCIIKLNSKFPEYEENSDIDVFCYNINSFFSSLVAFLDKYLKNGWEIRVQQLCDSHVQYDVYEPNSEILNIKFDVYSSLPKYTKVHIKSGFFTSVMDNRVMQNKIFVPSLMHECVLRYIEYIEYYDIRADKIKHISYILSMLDSTKQKEFFDMIYYYTKLPEDVYDGDVFLHVQENHKKFSNNTTRTKNKLKPLQLIFSIVNLPDKKHKQICIFGCKFKIKRTRKKNHKQV
ncbi:MAG: hypothetical protein IJ545_05840 [Alphaproteobacteria bacterium]|nr:hypothetical protein [Alphaproteobacteria bacterium]